MGGGIIINNHVRGFKSIIVYDKFYFFIRDSGKYGSLNQRSKKIFIKFIIVVHLVALKKI